MNYHYEIVVLQKREYRKVIHGALFVREEIKETNKVTFLWKIEELRNLQYPPSFFFTMAWKSMESKEKRK